MRLPVQHLAHLAGQADRREGLHEEVRTLLQHAVMHDGVVGIPGHLQHLDLLTQARALGSEERLEHLVQGLYALADLLVVRGEVGHGSQQGIELDFEANFPDFLC